MPDEDETTVDTEIAVEIYRDLNKGINNGSDEKGFEGESPEKQDEYLLQVSIEEYSATGQITPFVSKTGNKDFEKEINSRLAPIIDYIYNNPDEAISKNEEIIYVQSNAPYNPFNIVTTGDPVSVFNGSFVYSSTDCAIIGSGMNFSFTRSHSHQTLYHGPLGHKWDHSYNLRLRVAAGSQIIYLSTGTASDSIYRRHNVHGYWLAEGGEDGIILQTDEGFVCRSAMGIEFQYFRQHDTHADIWLITKIVDRFGNYLQFVYERNLLKRVFVNSPKREIVFVYDDGDKIIGITDFSNRRWTYTYDDFDDLIAVTTPGTNQYKEGLTTIYEYSSATQTDPTLQHNIVSVIDPNGQIFLENDYGSDPNLLSYNRVTRQRQGGGETSFDYADVVEDFDFPYEIFERPTYQTIVIGRDGYVVRYLFNSYGNKILEEKQARVNGLPKIISTHYRYNKDGNLTGTISPEGVIVQFLYGRDYFERKSNIDQDYSDIDDQNLDYKTRQSFNRLLASVKRGRYYSIVSLNLSNGLWADIFPDIYNTSEEDIIQKTTYERDYGQPLTISDPRHTYSADPDFNEPSDYHFHLTSYSYTPDTHSEYQTLRQIESPSITSPDGSVIGPAIVEVSLYDQQGRVLETTGPEGLVTQMTYYDSLSGTLEGFLKEIHSDPSGLSIKVAVERDELGRAFLNYSPKHFDDTDGKFVTRIEYNKLDQIISVTSSVPFAFKSRRRYNRAGNISEQSFERKKPDNTTLDEPLLVNTFHYDEEFRLIKTTLGGRQYLNHKKWLNTYDAAGRLFLTISPAGKKTKLYYNEISLVAKVVNDHGGVSATSKIYYDADSRKIRTIDPSGSATKFFYDALGQMIEAQDPLGNRRFYTYDKLGNILIQRFFEKRNEDYYLLFRSEYLYDELGRLIKTSIDEFDESIGVPEGEVNSAFVQHGLGQQQTILYFYDKNGQVTKVVDTIGRVLKSEYDKVGRRAKVTDPYGNESKYIYDKHSNIIRSEKAEVIRDPTNDQIVGHRFFASVYGYDELDRLITQTDTLGNCVRFEYDSLNHMRTVIDPLANKVEGEYDIFGRLRQTTQYIKNESSVSSVTVVKNGYLYDLDNFLIEQTDALERVTKFQYDSMGRLVSTVLPDFSQDAYTYDQSSRLTVYKDRNGLLSRYHYDSIGRLTALNIDDAELLPNVEVGGSRTNIYRYDGAGRVTYMQNEVCEHSFSFNSLNMLKAEDLTYIAPGNPANRMQFLIKRNYDTNSALSDIVYPSGRTIHYRRDSIDRVTSIEQLAKGQHYPGDNNLSDIFTIMRIEYQGSQRSRIIRHNQTSTQFHYDRKGRTIEIEHTYKDGLLSHLQYIYDAAGNVRQRKEQSSHNTETKVFHYDSLYRIVDVSRFDSTTLDDLTSLYPANDVLPEIIPNMQSHMDALVEENVPEVRGYVYDAVGNRLTKTETNLPSEQYLPDNLDRYQPINGEILNYDQMGNLIEDEKLKYIYDFNNRLTSVKRKDNDSMTKFYYDPLGRRIYEIQDDQSRLLIYDNWNVIEEYNGNILEISAVSDEGMDNIAQVSADGANFWCCSDILKSVTHVLKGEEVDRYNGYDEFGKIITPTQDGIVQNHFAGKRLMPGLEEKYDFIYRIYDPKIGRFLQRDPLGDVDGTNLYTYAANNPQSNTDPFGTYRQDMEKVYGDIPVPYDLWRAQFSGWEPPLRTLTEQERITAQEFFKGTSELQSNPSQLYAEKYQEYRMMTEESFKAKVKQELQENVNERNQRFQKSSRIIDASNTIANTAGVFVVATGTVFGGAALLPTAQTTTGSLMTAYSTRPGVALAAGIGFGFVSAPGSELPGPPGSGALEAAIEEAESAIKIATTNKSVSNAFGHVVVGIEKDAESAINWYHQVPADRREVDTSLDLVKGGYDAVVKPASPYSWANITSVPVSNAQALAAEEKALELIAQGATKYNIICNNCTTSAMTILNAAGINPPWWARTPGLLQYWLNQFVKTQ